MPKTMEELREYARRGKLTIQEVTEYLNRGWIGDEEAEELDDLIAGRASKWILGKCRGAELAATLALDNKGLWKGTGLYEWALTSEENLKRIKRTRTSISQERREK